MTEYLQVPGGKAVLQRGMPTQILIPRSALKGSPNSVFPAAVILMIAGWIWEYLTSTVGLKQDRILEGIDILKSYMEKAPGFVKKEDINTEWDTVVHSRFRELFEKSVDLQNQINFMYLGIPASDYKKLEEDFRKEEESKADPSNFKKYYGDEKGEYEGLFSFAMPSDEGTMRSDIGDIKDMLTEIKQFVDQGKSKEEDIKTPADTSKIEGEVVPVSCDFTEDQARLIAQQIVAQMQGDVSGGGAEKTGQAVSHEDLGIEVRDSKRSIMGLLNEIKNLIANLIKVIEKRAMTFDDIYTKFGKRLEREVRDSRGRR